ncbi:[protein-PII] uridylyltransferase [Parahaliea sp. F7430]|uniref:Bifunctional uridylyltransferase/uridylyl-removing enzyme n=1 Tax=Sediminihaliea albiluteola TaxID=2758564 RepID=A0A7W2TVJ8_9GAMM|nr:[protein-PII] uridylyltransferase [Sediminihaliea albiluteola]MBA6412755.1 [protein-PII] uridylyltransferase [Sediminihaliea albiluteola]
MNPADHTLPQAVFDPAVFTKALASGSPAKHAKAALNRAAAYFEEQFYAGVEAGPLIRLRAAFMDSMLGILWDSQQWPSTDIALVAVGGYGRGELHPHSDIDILIITGHEADDENSHRHIEIFLTLLWDTGLTIGHSVRTVNECRRRAARDIIILTNLMEARVIRGDAALMQAVHEATAPEQMWPSGEFFRAKLAEQQARHNKYADTEYNLEPNVKSSPGGLRDLQIIGWIAMRHFGVKTLDDLPSNDFLTPDERRILDSGREFMWRVRYALHIITGREENRLLFDHQRELAKMWGFEDGDKLAVEQFMQLYYRSAISLGQLNEVLVQNFDQAILHATGKDELRQINDRFVSRNGYLEVQDEMLFQHYPSALLEVFLLCASDQDIIGVGAPTIRLLRDNRHLIDDHFRADPRNHKLFLDILKAPYKVTRQLRRMTRYGILGNYLPEFGRIVGQMQHDLFHSYTVDAHTLQVIQNMRRFLRPEFEERFPISSRVTRRLPQIELLYIAGLYHDIGKGRGGDHSELGAVDAERFCQQHGLLQRDTELVVWLVRNHLTMSAVSQRKDISDPEVIQQFAQHVGDEDRLDYLLALTVADINGTNPTLWNAWRASLLRQLYTETKRALRRGLENPIDKQAWINNTRQNAIDLLECRGFTVQELEELWRERGEDYFLREQPEDIVWHTEAIAGHYDKTQPLVLVRNSSDSSVANATQIFIHARSHAHLFSRVCAELEQLDLSVHDARIYSASDNMTLDTFFVLDSNGNSIAEDGARLRQIKTHLTEALGQNIDQPVFMQRLTPRQMKSFPTPTETRMSIDEIKQVSVLEVASPDRPGLLARIGQVFVEQEVLLQAAKIQTLGERVEDVFFITDLKAQPITDPAHCDAIQQAICDRLDKQI